MPFERKLEGLICSDPKISLFVRLITLVAAAFFGYLFLLLKKSNWLERILVKNHQADAAREDGAKRAFVFSKERR